MTPDQRNFIIARYEDAALDEYLNAPEAEDFGLCGFCHTHDAVDEGGCCEECLKDELIQETVEKMWRR